MVGPQAFESALAFNANIGAWNTAAVTNLSHVCAVLDARSLRHCRVHIYMYMDIFALVRTCHMYPQSTYECFPSARTACGRHAGVVLGVLVRMWQTCPMHAPFRAAPTLVFRRSMYAR